MLIVGFLQIFLPIFGMHKEHVDKALEDHDSFYRSKPLIHEIDIKDNRLKYIENSAGACEHIEIMNRRDLYHYNRLISI
jgi:hypothetical protein